jgi:ribosomal protein S18 acetylase RimI-like enzyme
MPMSNSLNVKEIQFLLNSQNYETLIKIIKEENNDSILATLNKKLVKKFIEISIKSENIFFYTCQYKSEIVGYALLAKKPSFLFSEFKSIKFAILINLLNPFYFKSLLNILIAFSKIDLILLSRDKNFFIANSLNLNLLAIKKNFQSKGFGKEFIQSILKDIKKKYGFNGVTVEANNSRSASFYQNKVNFCYFGKKLRFFKNTNIYEKIL